MIIEATQQVYALLLQGRAPDPYAPADTPIASPEVLHMLAEVAATVRATFAPASWLIVEKGEAAGILSFKRPPEHGEIEIAYGIAPSRRGRGIAGRAVRDVAAWAEADPRLTTLLAETLPDNFTSHRVLIANGFVHVGERVDEEDGLVWRWRRRVQPAGTQGGPLDMSG